MARQSYASRARQEQNKYATVWLQRAIPAVTSLPRGTVLTVDSGEVQFLSPDAGEREELLRDLTRRGYLEMASHFKEDGKTWAGFSWTVR